MRGVEIAKQEEGMDAGEGLVLYVHLAVDGPSGGVSLPGMYRGYTATVASCRSQ